MLGTGYALAFAMLRDRQAAEDAVQEAALKAWRAVANANRDGGPLRPWFLAIVGNQCRDTAGPAGGGCSGRASCPRGQEAQEDHADQVADRMDAERAMAQQSREQRAPHRAVCRLRAQMTQGQAEEIG